jgi:hypothetical protein
MFSYSEMKKPKARRSGEPAIIKLSNDEPFNTLKAQILKCISEALKPKKLAYDDYKVTFTVARHQTSPLSLKKQSEFDHLLECVLKMKAPAAKILVEASKKPDPPTVRTLCAYMLFNSKFYSQRRNEDMMGVSRRARTVIRAREATATVIGRRRRRKRRYQMWDPCILFVMTDIVSSQLHRKRTLVNSHSMLSCRHR